MNSLTECLLIIGLSTVLSVTGLILVRRRFSPELLKACHEVGGVMLAVIGTLYAIIIGMIVVNSQAKVDQASQMAISESNMLSSIYHLATTFDQPAKEEIKEAIHEYAACVVAQDWSLVELGKEKEASIPAYQKLWRTVTKYTPSNNRDSQSYSLMLSNMEELTAARRFRMVSAKGGLPLVLWAVLIAGGVLTIWFTYFFYMESLTAQIIMTAGVSVFMSMNVYLIYICQNPYRVELGVKRSGFGYDFTPRWFEKHARMEAQLKNEAKQPIELEPQR